MPSAIKFCAKIDAKINKLLGLKQEVIIDNCQISFYSRSVIYFCYERNNVTFVYVKVEEIASQNVAIWTSLIQRR